MQKFRIPYGAGDRAANFTPVVVRNGYVMHFLKLENEY